MDPIVGLITDVISADVKGSVAGGLVQLFQSGRKRDIKLTDDESYEDNVKFIKEHLGPDVDISKDTPPIYEALALRIGDNEYLKNLDGAMKLALKKPSRQSPSGRRHMMATSAGPNSRRSSSHRAPFSPPMKQEVDSAPTTCAGRIVRLLCSTKPLVSRICWQQTQ